MENFKPIRRQRDTTDENSLENHTIMNFNVRNDTRPSVSGNTRVLRIPGGKTKRKLNIGTWNVRSLYEAGKLANTIVEMNKHNIDILGISETWWPDSGEFISHNTKMYYSGNLNKNHRNGVGILVKSNIANSVIGFIPKSDRSMLIKLEAKPININIIQVYAPTADKSNEEIELFYNEITELMNMTKPHEINIILGDFNAKVGRDHVPGVTGKYGLGDRNERGDRLIQFCQEQKMKITNTLFCLPQRRLYTWKSPQDRKDNIVRNQIDYLLINKRYSSFITKTSTYPGADVKSDHVLLMSNMCCKLTLTKKQILRKKLDIGKLENQDIRANMKERINLELNGVNRDGVENMWNSMKNTIKTVATNTLGNYKKPQNKEWMTNNILELMEERRKHKNKNYELYYELNREIQCAIRRAKNEHLSKQCQEIEQLQQLHDDFNLHKKLKEAAGVYNRPIPKVLYINNRAVFETNDKKLVWSEYIRQIFTDNNRSRNESLDPRLLTGNAITRMEVESALQSLRNKKACGPDEIPSEILKLIDDENIQLFVELFNYIYDSGQYPEDWLKSTFITIPKKSHPKQCSDYRLISLMSHSLKIFLKIIHSRIYNKCEEVMGKSQFGFKEGMGTREALFSIQVLIQKCRDVHKDVFLCFVDYEKAFDTVQHDKLVEILISIGIDGKEIQCIKNLYWNQTAQVDINGELTDNIIISRGVRQGCILSPLLFNIYSEKIFQEAFSNVRKGILINGIFVNNIRYADDTTLMADSLSALQDLLNRLTTCSERYGLKINISKTKLMVISKADNHITATLKINDISVERVKNFQYLGVKLNERWDNSKEVRCRIEMARDAFLKYKKVLCSHDINIETKLRFTKTHVWSVLLYASETWTLKAVDIQKLEAFEMWIYRRILKIPWTHFISNSAVLARVNRERELIKTIKKRKTSYLGHIMRNQKYKLLQGILRGKIEGNACRGRKEISWVDNIRAWTGIRDVGNLLSEARNRDSFAEIVKRI